MNAALVLTIAAASAQHSEEMKTEDTGNDVGTEESDDKNIM